MLRWSIDPLVLDLKYTWKISRNASDQKTNLIVTVTDGRASGRGEAAPNVRYNESAEEGVRIFETIKTKLDDAPASENPLDVIKGHPLFNSLSFAIESAWFHYNAGRSGKTIYDLLGLKPAEEIKTSYTIPIMDTGLLKSFFMENRLNRFPFIKLKVNSDDAFESLRHLVTFCDQPVMVDANESFTDVEQCIYWMEKVKRIPLVLIEQPMPAKLFEESVYLKKYSPFTLFADESMTDDADFGKLKKAFDGVNMKLMKAGGYINGLRLLKEAKRNNMKTMIGCMVETTLGISSAMNLASMADYTDLDSFLLIKDEPFGLVREQNGILSGG